MGTRADFYDGVGKNSEYLGSVSWDGYPDGFDKRLFFPVTSWSWREKIASMQLERDDFITPEEGWPWPWETSKISDFSYWRDEDNIIYVDYSGYLIPVLEVLLGEIDLEKIEDKIHNGKIITEYRRTEYPIMKDKNSEVNIKKSGMIIIEG